VPTALRIGSVSALEVLDSRGNPTLNVSLTLADGRRVEAGVPSGASTGSGEAIELRDGDPARFGGRGVLTAARAVDTEIAPLLSSREWGSQQAVDDAMIELDGTTNKARLGANAVVGVSMAVARAFAVVRGVPLYASLAQEPALDGASARVPVPHFNVVNGGAHAQNNLDFQEFMLAPVGLPTIRDAVRAGAEIYAALRKSLHDKGFSTGLGDEGGFAPDVTTPEEVCELLVTAIEVAGYRAGRDAIAIALDPAATGFSRPDHTYLLAGKRLTAAEMVDRYERLTADFPIYLIEDGLAEDDSVGWQHLTARLGTRIRLVGDDNFVTDPARIARAATDGIGNAALIKVNQIGSVSETLEALATCRRVGYGAMISHRSGETPDDFIADLAVASGSGRIKSGAPARGERVAKYNRLLSIAAQAPELAYGLADV
jgi:enolase 1/2/3